MKKIIIPMMLLMLLSCAIPDKSIGKTVFISITPVYSSSNVTPLPYSAKDGETLSSQLSYLSDAYGMGFEEHMFIEENGFLAAKGTRIKTDASSIIPYIDSLPAEDDDLTVFFFSGHGIAYNGQSAIAAGPGCGSSDMIYIKDIRASLNRRKGRKLMLIDACYSGSESGKGDIVGTGEVFSSEGELLGTDVWSAFTEALHGNKAERDGVYVLSACTESQMSAAGAAISGYSKTDEYSVFTYCLLKALGYDFDRGEPHTSLERITFYTLYKRIISFMPSELWKTQTAQPTRTSPDMILFSFR